METKHIEVNPVRRVGCGVQEMLEPEAVMIAAARLPARSEPAKSQFLRLCRVQHNRNYVQSAIMGHLE